MGNYTSLLFDNDIFGTVLLIIDESLNRIGGITTKSTYYPLTISNSHIFDYFELDKKKQIKEFEKLLLNYAPRGRAFLSSSYSFTAKKKGKVLTFDSIKDLVIGEVYYNNMFNHFMSGENRICPLTYKGIFPGTLEAFYDLYKEVMFEESLKGAKRKDETKEKKLREEFKRMLQ